MKTIEFYLNIVHFCYYKADYKLHLLSNKVNPFKLLAEIPFVKRRHKKMGIVDFQKEIDKVFSDKNFGLSTTVAGGAILLVLFVFFFGIVGIFIKYFISERLTNIHFITFGILSALICYIFVFKGDKYLQYFDKFEKWTKAEKRKYNWLTFGSTIIVFVLWILSF